MQIYTIESRGQRVLTSAQLAECYGTTVDCIKQNFHSNKGRFKEGKHYITLVGDELRNFKNKVSNSNLAKNQIVNEVRIPNSAEVKAKYQFDTQFKYAKSLYLWTEKGALLHAKSLNTDKAWEVYDYLVDFYFREKQPTPEKNAVVPVDVEVSKVPDGLPDKKEGGKPIPDMTDPILIFRALLKVAEEKGICVASKPFKEYNSMLRDDMIGIRDGLTLREVDYELALELFYSFVYYDGGNMAKGALYKEYNMQAERAAEMILVMLNALINIRRKKMA